MNNEMRKFYKYAGNSIRCHYSGDKGFLEKIVLNIDNNKMKAFERPDMIVNLGDKLLAIEHFEFDASSSNKKGSLDKRKLADRDRNFDKIINNSNISEEPIILNTSVDCTYSAYDYINNFKNVFQTHLLKIKEYKNHIIKENLVENNNDILMCFFIIDTTPLGCYYLNNGELNTFYLFQVAEFIDAITEANEIDCVFYGFFDGKKESLAFMSNSTEAIEATKKIKIIDFRVDEFFSFNPKETRFCMNIN